MQKIWAIVCFAFFVPPPLLPQLSILEQYLYTNFDFPVAAVQQHNTLWIATTGGVYQYLWDADSSILIPPQKLYSLDLLSILYDSVGHQIVIGSENGYLQLYQIETGKIRLIPEISLKQGEYGSVAIRALAIVDRWLFIGCDFGLVLFHLDSLYFQSTVTVFSGVSQPQITSLLVLQDTLWVGSSRGLFKAPLNAAFWKSPNNPTLWGNVPTPAQNESIRDLAHRNDTLIVATESKVFCYTRGMFTLLLQVDNPPIVGVEILNGALWIADQFEIIDYDRMDRRGVFPARLSGLAKYSSGSEAFPVLLLHGSGVWIFRNSTGFDTLQLNQISGNIIGDIALAPTGELWYATDIDGRGRGFGFLQNGTWNVFLPQKYPEIQTTDWYRVFVQQNGIVWLSSWGKGVLEIQPQGDSLRFFHWDQTNAPLTPFQGDFLVVGDITEDQQQRVWVTNPWGNGIAVRFNGQWYTAFPQLSSTYRLSRIVADPVEGVWVASHLSSSGLWYCSAGADLSSAEDDQLFHLTSSQGLMSNQITTLHFDRNGWLWLGTPAGLQVLLNPLEVRNAGQPFFYSIEELQGQNVLSLDEDATGLLWIGTSTGIWVLDLQSLEILGHLDQSELALFDTKINALQIDRKNGWVYCGTQRGLLAFRTPLIEAKQTVDSVRCYPQPFVVGKHSALTITNLPVSATVHIVTAAGEHVREISARNSGTVIWDGKGRNGQFVTSGIYYIIYFSEGLSQEGIRKVLIINP